jgi:2-phospho-L-lactate guanylyltransferase
MRVVVPFGAAEPKTRLAPALDATERRVFARVMLVDVLAALVDAGYEPTVVADEPVDLATLVDELTDGTFSERVTRASRPTTVTSRSQS